jgi:ribonuclease G
MSKELIVSSGPHETKVAILEDDELVEVYFEREKRHGLAGSIYKGRVTRVLPGMQSAFVNIGLDRDAFLYVSDFFEDNDEYDRVVTTVEDKVVKMQEKGELPEAADAPPAAPAAAAPVLEPPAPRAPRSEEAGDDRWARRGRRGRRRGGRGFPESKYAAPQRAPIPSRPVEPAPDSSDFEVLPGETLAKYGRPASEDEIFALPTAELPEPSTETTPMLPVEPVAEEPDLPEIQDPAAPEHSFIELVSLGAADRELAEAPAAPAAVDAAAAASEEEDDDESESLPTEIEEGLGILDLSEPAVEPEATLPTSDDQPAPTDEEAEPLVEEEEAPETEGADLAPVGTGGEAREASIRDRNHGRRFLHRGGRRPRRRGRPEGRERRGPERAAPLAAAAEPVAVRTAETSITDLLKEGQEIIVQIAKEPLGKKGARITSHIALPGRYLVYMPTVDHVGVSRKIQSEEERHRLKRIVQTHRVGMPGGFIVRTAGEGHSEDEIRSDMMFLYNLWLDMRQKRSAATRRR